MVIKIIYINIFLISLNFLYGNIWIIGPNQQYKFCSSIQNLISDGDTIFIEEFHYFNDSQVKWAKDNLYIKGLGLKPILEAGPLIENDLSNGKGIFVIAGNNITIDNLEFRNAKVVDNNGAGIRQEGRNLVVRNCIFFNNEMGILCGTIPQCKTTIEFCVFSQNGSTANPGYQHNVYINNIDTLIFQYNSSINAIAEGHELKSRAKYNYIAYNRIANIDSEDSRTIDLPNGGITILIGNVIEQGPNSANNNIIGFGLEGLSNASPHNLFIINNTIINKKDKGSFIQFPNDGLDSFIFVNNIVCGAVSSGVVLGNANYTFTTNNIENVDITFFNFSNAQNSDYHLNENSPCIDNGYKLQQLSIRENYIPKYEYIDVASCTKRYKDVNIDIGAFESNTTAVINEEPYSFIAFPNPFSNELNIKSEEKKEYEIYNHFGQKILNTKANQTIDTQLWFQGIYFIKSDNYTESCKVLIFNWLSPCFFDISKTHIN